MLSFNMEYKEGQVFMEVKETKCVFKEDTHQYFLVDAKTGEQVKELISVTTLLKKHGLSPDYSAVPSETLKAKAEYGTLVHKELEQYIKDGEVGFTQELQNFIDYCNVCEFKPIDSEFIVHNDIVAGTVDLLGALQIAVDDEIDVLGDFKTTSTLHKEAVSWQLSIYAYLYGEMFGGNVQQLNAFHFKGGELNVVGIDFKPTKEIEKLLEAERNGEFYQKQELAVKEEITDQLIVALRAIKQFDAAKKEFEDKANEMKKVLINEFKNQSVKSFENEFIKITYTPPTTRETFDDSKLKAEMPEIYKKYLKTGNVKEKLTITLRD